MSLPLYLLSGVPWTLYCVSRQLRNPPADHVFERLILCIFVNVLFWPAAQLVAMARGSEGLRRLNYGHLSTNIRRSAKPHF